MKKTLALLLSAMLVVASVPVFSAFAADEENIVYVEAGAAGIGTDDDPFGTLEEAVAELDGTGGTIYIFGAYDIGGFKLDTWEGMITISGGSDDAIITIPDNGSVAFTGPATLKDIQINIGKYAHFNSQGAPLCFDFGEDADVGVGMIHVGSSFGATVDESYVEYNSGKVGALYFGGAYNSSLSNGVIGDHTLVVNGGTISSITCSADHYMDTHVGISVGGNANLIINGGNIAKIGFADGYQMEIMGALNVIFNNGMEKPETFDLYDAAGGNYIIMSDKGGSVMPTADIGMFKIKADEGKVAVIDGEQVLNGVHEFADGETAVTWVAFDGEQPADEEEAPAEEPIEIKLTIGKDEIVKNGEATKLDVPAQIIDSRTMVPLRAIFEALGATVEWDDATKTVTSEKGDTKVSLTIGKAAITVNGADKALDVPAQIVESRTLVPVRAIAEAYGCDVAWDDATKTVTITK